MGPVVLYLFLGLLVLWTARIARSKARNPWLWAGGACVLMIPSPHILGIVPMIVLMFLKSTQMQTRPTPKATACPKCHATQPNGLRFCTNCGWEMGIPYFEKPLVERRAQLDSATVKPEVATSSEPEAAPVQTESLPISDSLASDQPPISQESPATPEEIAEETPPTDVEAAKEPRPLEVPTAASMTERGVRLVNQGRIQEAIDQFTKAIALDPDYSQAWGCRAEAYSRLGRGEQAAEDQRRLDALNASSSSS